MASTPNRCVRVSDELWDAAHATARSEGRKLSEVITELLSAYVEQTTQSDRDEQAG